MNTSIEPSARRTSARTVAAPFHEWSTLRTRSLTIVALLGWTNPDSDVAGATDVRRAAATRQTRHSVA